MLLWQRFPIFINFGEQNTSSFSDVYCTALITLLNTAMPGVKVRMQCFSENFRKKPFDILIPFEKIFPGNI